MRAKASLRVRGERPIKAIANFSNREPLRVRYVELIRLRQAVLEAEATTINATRCSSGARIRH